MWFAGFLDSSQSIAALGRVLPIVVGGGLLLSLQMVVRRRLGTRVGRRGMVPLATLLEGIPEAVFLFDKDGRIVDCNQAAEQLCGLKCDDLAGTSIVELNRLLSARDEYDQFVTPSSMGVNRALAGEVVRELRRVFRHPTERHVVETVTSASPIGEPQGGISGALLIVRDVTQISQLNRRLADAQRHREVGQMAAGLAHDFNNVLDTILQATELLEMSSFVSQQERLRYSDMIRRSVQNGSEIINRVREYLRTGSGENTAVDLRQVLADVVELARPRLYRRSEFRISARLEAVPLVLGNVSDLSRMFTNLFINGLEAMPEGGHLTISCEAIGDHVRVIITDTGQGISPELQKQVFMPYFTTKPQGTGLGLSGAQRIVNALHGRIQFHSTVGKGTSLIVELPVAVSIEEPAAGSGAAEKEAPDRAGSDRGRKKAG
jgi:PAS domain S-box-containing protein